MKNIWFKSVILALAGFSTTSCGDFLEIYPLTMVHENNFWTEKADIDQMVTGCYTRMQSEDFMRRLFVWGEVRSDNVGRGFRNGYNADSDEGRLVVDNLLATNGYTNWSSFYYVINRCNLVIEKAPQVAAVDPSYLESDVKATIAEVTALRALCYFYLVRTFKDVPYYTEALVNDEQPLELAPTNGDEILRNSIADLIRVYPDALKSWPKVDGQDMSYGRITQNAIFALLADMYLWVGDYANAAQFAQRVIDSKKEFFTQKGYSSLYFTNSFPIIPDFSQTLPKGTAYDYNFGEGGGPESIFELVFTSSKNDNTKPNDMVGDFYYQFFTDGDRYKTDWGLFGPAQPLWRESSSPNLFLSQNDTRIKESICVDNPSDVGMAHMAKYAYTGMSTNFTSENGTTNGPYSYDQRGLSTTRNDANWILYRVSEMMLIKAEALIYMMNDNGSEEDQELADEAFNLIKTVADRSAQNTDSKMPKVNTKSELIELVYDERRRELMFEGKRWFDLVRRTIREGNNPQYLLNKIEEKLSGATTTGKFGNYMAIYWPYNYYEMQVNANLKQNPAYPSSENNSFESTN